MCKVQERVISEETELEIRSETSQSGSQNAAQTLLRAVGENIRDTLDEIDFLRGSIQYWESRRLADDPHERDLLTEAFRIMHGELLGLTARVKELLTRSERSAEA